MNMSLFFPHPALTLFTFFRVPLHVPRILLCSVQKLGSKTKSRSLQQLHVPSSWHPCRDHVNPSTARDTGHSFALPNSPLHTTIFEFSLAYFMVDLLHYVVFFPKDILFILHHVATIYVLITCRYVVRHGAYGLVGLLLLAEITSPFQNVWSLAGYRNVDAPAAAKLHELLSPPFFCLYSVVRGILGPLYVIKLYSYISGAGNGMVPSWAWISWLAIIIVAILVSILWVKSHWVHWFRERMHQAHKKGR